MLSQVEFELNQSFEWQFDAFRLSEVTGGRALSTLGYFLLSKSGLIDHFNLKPSVLTRSVGFRQWNLLYAFFNSGCQ